MKMNSIKSLLKELISKKYVANIIVILALAVIALTFSSEFNFQGSTVKDDAEEAMGNSFVEKGDIIKTEEQVLEARLKEILEKIEGSGEVDVMVTFEMGSEIVPAADIVENRNTTEEKDSNGGVRTVISENYTENIITTNDSRENNALVLKEIKPKVRGVIVAAEGAKDIRVEKQLYDAVKTVLQISGNQVQIYTKN